VETWGLGGVNNETKIAGLITDFASVRAGPIQKSIISPAWTDNRFFLDIGQMGLASHLAGAGATYIGAYGFS